MKREEPLTPRLYRLSLPSAIGVSCQVARSHRVPSGPMMQGEALHSRPERRDTVLTVPGGPVAWPGALEHVPDLPGRRAFPAPIPARPPRHYRELWPQAAPVSALHTYQVDFQVRVPVIHNRVNNRILQHPAPCRLSGRPVLPDRLLEGWLPEMIPSIPGLVP